MAVNAAIFGFNEPALFLKKGSEVEVCERDKLVSVKLPGLNWVFVNSLNKAIFCVEGEVAKIVDIVEVSMGEIQDALADSRQHPPIRYKYRPERREIIIERKTMVD